MHITKYLIMKLFRSKTFIRILFQIDLNKSMLKRIDIFLRHLDMNLKYSFINFK